MDSNMNNQTGSLYHTHIKTIDGEIQQKQSDIIHKSESKITKNNRESNVISVDYQTITNINEFDLCLKTQDLLLCYSKMKEFL